MIRRRSFLQGMVSGALPWSTLSGLAVPSIQAPQEKQKGGVKAGRTPLTTTTVTRSLDRITIGNQYLSRTFATKNGILQTVELENKISGDKFAVCSREFEFGSKGSWVSAQDFRLRGVLEEDIEGGGKRLLFTLQHSGSEAVAEVRLELLADKPYMRKTVAFHSGKLWPEGWLSDVTVEDLSFAGRAIVSWGIDESTADVLAGSARVANQRGSFPVLGESFFMGLEFPVAVTRVHEGGTRVTIKHNPYVRIGHAWNVSRAAVFGVGPKGKGREAFEDYFDDIHVGSPRLNFEYNNYWSVRPTEENIYPIMDAIDGELKRPFGVTFDTFLIDAFWSNERSIWEIDAEKFPHGIDGLVERGRKAGYRMGLWVSAGGTLMDANWAAAQGYEVGPAAGGEMKACMMLGSKWQRAFTDALICLVKRGIEFFKFDFYSFLCDRDDHGHAPGEKGREMLVHGMIQTLREVRRVNPNVWFKESRMASDFVSPWWALAFNVISGPWHSDSPVGVVPAPNYRDAKITARDAAWVQGMKASKVLAPARASQSLGVVHQDTYPALDDMITNVMRGCMLIPHYVNVKYFRKSEWRFLAHLMKWARANEQTLTHTKTFGGNPRKREVYGFAHFGKGRGFVFLRNPFVDLKTYELRLDATIGFPEVASPFVVRKIYPHRQGMAAAVKRGDRLEVLLNSYEALVLEFVARADLDEPVPLGVRYTCEKRNGHSYLVMFMDSRSPRQTEIVAPSGPAVRTSITASAPREANIEGVTLELVPEPWITGSLLHMVQDRQKSETRTEALTMPANQQRLKNTFAVDVPDDASATLCFLLESEVTLNACNCKVTVDNVVRSSANGPARVGVEVGGLGQDLSDALTTLSNAPHEVRTPSVSGVRFVRPEDDFQQYPHTYYFRNHWLWVLTDVGPGKHTVHFEALLPALAGVPIGPNRFGSWVCLRSRLQRQEQPWVMPIATHSSPQLYLPEQEHEIRFLTVTALQDL